MSAPQITLSEQEVQQAASAGLQLLGKGTTLVPGNLRRQVGVLEGILAAVLNGHLVVVSRNQRAVESEPEAPQGVPDTPDAEPRQLLNTALSVDKSIGAAEQSELPGPVGGPADRARHIFWMQSLANKFGPDAARIVGLLNEIPGFLSGDADESLRDLETNKMALMFADGEPDMDAIRKMVVDLAIDPEGRTVAANPLEVFRGQQRAKTPVEAVDQGLQLATTRTP